MYILLVEDEYVSRDRLARFLRKLGHQVVECCNGCDALEHFKTAFFHMVMSDIKMPGMSGIELLRALKSLPDGKDVDVVLFTGHSDMESVIEALRAGAYDYLLKPIHIEELTVLLERIAEHQLLLRENRVLTEKFEDEVKAQTVETEQELARLKEAFARTLGVGEIGVFSDRTRAVFRHASKFQADRSIPVLIQGETGTGKELIARYIHYGNLNVLTPFVDINCAALAPSLFESELFGYEAGAFTGGLSKGQKGKLDMANRGTIFLDEIAELPVDLQAKLLRVIQEKDFYRVGGLKKINVDVRIICATNANIEKEVEQGAFRQDLYYRLNVGTIFLPPLRERTEEILPLANMFLSEFSRKRGKRFCGISEAAAEILRGYKWPGNVRELRNSMEWVSFMHDDEELKPLHLQSLLKSNSNYSCKENSLPQVLDPGNFILPEGGLDLESFLNKIVSQALKMHNGNKSGVARYLGISRSSLYCRLERLKK